MKNLDLLQTKLLTPDELAERLRVSRWTIYAWISEGRIRGIKIGGGGLVRIPKSEIEKLLIEESPK